jgi:hypothetical protein
VLTKADAVQDPDVADRLTTWAREQGMRHHVISAVAGEGIAGLVRDVADSLDRLALESPAESGLEP